MNNKPWTASDIDKLAKCIGEELSAAETAARLGRTAAACKDKAGKLGLKFKSRPIISPDLRERIISLHGKYDFARDVAEECGVTKGVVLGVWFRAGLSGQTKSSRTRRMKQERVQQSQQEPPSLTLECAVPLVELRPRQCRFIVSGEGIDSLYCGLRAEPSSSWCAAHRERCITRILKPVGGMGLGGHTSNLTGAFMRS